MNIKNASACVVASYVLMLMISMMFTAFRSVEFLQAIKSYVLVVANAIIVYVTALNIYFQVVEPLKPVPEGVKLGMVWIVGYLVLDILMLSLGFFGSEWSKLTQWNVLTGYAEAFLIPIIIGFMEEGGIKK